MTHLVKEVHSAGGLGSSTLIVRSDGVGAVLLIDAAVVRFAVAVRRKARAELKGISKNWFRSFVDKLGTNGTD